MAEIKRLKLIYCIYLFEKGITSIFLFSIWDNLILFVHLGHPNAHGMTQTHSWWNLEFYELAIILFTRQFFQTFSEYFICLYILYRLNCFIYYINFWNLNIYSNVYKINIENKGYLENNNKNLFKWSYT